MNENKSRFTFLLKPKIFMSKNQKELTKKTKQYPNLRGILCRLLHNHILELFKILFTSMNRKESCKN